LGISSTDAKIDADDDRDDSDDRRDGVGRVHHDGQLVELGQPLTSPAQRGVTSRSSAGRPW
jgi:hypothetical protein